MTSEPRNATDLALFHLFKDGVDVLNRTHRHFRHHFALGRKLEGLLQILTGANQRTVQTDAAGKAVVDNLNPGETQVQVSAPGYEVAMATMNVKTGQRYVLPVELLATASAQHRFYGQVVDAVSQMPIKDARVVLTGATSGTVTTPAKWVIAESSVDALPSNSRVVPDCAGNSRSSRASSSSL